VRIIVSTGGELQWLDRVTRCALGRNGVREDKREGDGATPAGSFPLREVYFRADRVAAPSTGLPTSPISPDLGWCDDPADAAYNRPVRLPYAARHERLWRDDELYDLVVVIGYNDDPVEPGRGSAVFLHVARSDFAPTEGCVAMRFADLSDLLRECRPGDQVAIETD
jgi:L,D-peptidoglycan transpeptidase YkuD (ErfK/YbiS/YcfS/YnhG family)